MSDYQRQKCEVAYQIGTYSGTEIVYCDPDDENEDIYAKCKRQVYRGGPSIGMAYESFRILSREDYYGE